MAEDTMPAATSRKAPTGTPESAVLFTLQLTELGMSIADLARTMQRHGDDRPRENIETTLRRVAKGEARFSGELKALLGMMLRSQRRRMAKAAEKAA
ncbi:hypothetical protein GXW71_06445 [Roseomonas hellenica]|uniref:Uncharacterized protein n=1 Tax=Plastoroseomonas hellenica TaxID=2687306 RepID=A0ABS5EUN6_9PROT|nr:hypothetical protein [Plastoroseomonas hellenica]MBR0663994.1 hypothetical protein [Plastoroseomonas hellenica]